MTHESTAPMHYSDAGAAQEPTATCQYQPCGKSFQARRKWQTFCSGPCRTAHHAAEHRKGAIREAAPVLFEALRRIAACDLPEGESAAAIATAAIRDLKAP